MIGNLYMLPYVFNEPIQLLDIWHSSNREHPDYLFEVEEFLEEPTPEEKDWIKKEYATSKFANLREECIRTFHNLKNEHDFKKRGEILNVWHRFSARHFQKNG